VIESLARVVRVESGYAELEAERRSACGHCTQGESCGVASVGKLFGPRPVSLRLPDTLGLQPGEQVVIGLPEGRLVAAAAGVYLLPLLAMIAVAVLGTASGTGTAFAVPVSAIVLIAGLWLAGRWLGRSASAARLRPSLLRRAR